MKEVCAYYGEFGWEITTLYPIIAWMDSRGMEVTLKTFPRSYFMYKDLKHVSLQNNEWDKLISGFKATHTPNKGAEKSIRTKKVFTPENSADIFKGYKRLNREIRKDCLPKEVEKHVIVHVRKFQKANKPYKGKTNRDWIKEYDALMDAVKVLGYSIYFVGDPKFSEAFPKRGEDIRELPMKKQLEIWKSAKACLGPSSGAMCLSQWIGVPVFMWGDTAMRTLEVRNEWTRAWNPFRTPSYHPWSFSPTPENMRRYKCQDCRPTASELIKGIEFMFEDMEWDRNIFKNNEKRLSDEY